MEKLKNWLRKIGVLKAPVTATDSELNETSATAEETTQSQEGTETATETSEENAEEE